MIASLLVFHLVGQLQLSSLDSLQARLDRGGDTLFVVNFWATWCKPCVEELPAFDRVHRESSGQHVKVLLVSLDQPKELKKVEAFISKRGITAEVILLNESKAHIWIDRVSTDWSGAIPATLFVQTTAGIRELRERQFTYSELSHEIHTLQRGKQ